MQKRGSIRPPETVAKLQAHEPSGSQQAEEGNSPVSVITVLFVSAEFYHKFLLGSAYFCGFPQARYILPLTFPDTPFHRNLLP